MAHKTDTLMDKPRYRINDNGVPVPRVDWDEIERMEINDQIVHLKKLLKTHGPFLLNSRRFTIWLNKNKDEIVAWHIEEAGNG